jgi:hypothetical protein
VADAGPGRRNEGGESDSDVLRSGSFVIFGPGVMAAIAGLFWPVPLEGGAPAEPGGGAGP